MTQERFPSLLDAFAFVKVFELRGQHRFDVLRVGSHDGSGSAAHHVDSVGSFDMTLSERFFEELEETVRFDSFDDFPGGDKALAERESAFDSCRVATKSEDLAMLLVASDLHGAERDDARGDEEG